MVSSNDISTRKEGAETGASGRSVLCVGEAGQLALNLGHRHEVAGVVANKTKHLHTESLIRTRWAILRSAGKRNRLATCAYSQSSHARRQTGLRTESLCGDSSK